MREITLEEAEVVGGAVGPPGAAIGGLAGAAGYIGSRLGGGTFQTNGFLAAVGVGALAGAITGPVGIGKALIGGFGGGVITGNVDRLGA
jgi:hypothetical protein